MFKGKSDKDNKTNKTASVYWMEEVKNKFVSSMSNVFLLTGNISDYAVPGILFENYLVQMLRKIKTDKFNGFNLITSYDIYRESNILFSDIDEEKENKNNGWDSLINSMTNNNYAKVLIIKYPKYLFPNGDNLNHEEKRKLLSIIQLMSDKNFISSNNMIILLSDIKSSIHPDLLSSSSKLTPINILNPSPEERLEFIEYLNKTSTVEFESEIDDNQLSRLTAGLNRTNIEDIFLLAEAKGKLETKSVLERKDALILKEYGEVIEVSDTMSLTLDDYAGQEHIKAKLYEDVINPLQRGDIKSIPKGLLFAGAPGLGKTFLYQCLAGSIGINALELKISKILDKYVGESEGKLEKAFYCLLAMAPVVVFVDEMDTALSRGGDHSNNVASNMFGMFLSFMSREDIRGKIIFVGATNYPNKIDGALKRVGRMDVKIPFLIPSTKERIDVFKIHLKKRNAEFEITDEEFMQLALKTPKYTPSEIENVVLKAVKVAKREGIDVIKKNEIEYALDCLIPASSDDIDEMTELALEEVNDYEYLNDFYGKVKRYMAIDKLSYLDALEKTTNEAQ